MNNAKRILAVVLIVITGLNCCFISGLINMKVQIKVYNKDELEKRLGNIGAYTEEYSEMYIEHRGNDSLCSIEGVDISVVSRLVCDGLYGSDAPYMYRYIIPEKIYDYSMSIYNSLISDVRYFPVAKDVVGKVKVTYENSWGDNRTFGGNRKHEGTDIMAGNNERGYFPVISMTEGTVENIGWLKLGGYRIGIRSPSGAYYYYAHLCEYAEGIKEGMHIDAGDVIGTMGDTGYSDVEGTTGNFPVHLHLGIYYECEGEEKAFNPYYILKAVEKYKREFI